MAYSAKKRSFQILLMAVGLLLAAEIVVRFRAERKYGELLDIYDIYQVDEDLDLLVAKPNLSLLFARKYQIDIDSKGFRNPEVVSPKPAGSIRFGFLGGSTTFCGQAGHNGLTWPALLMGKLRELHPELAFDYVNAGVTGYSIEDSVKSLRHRLAPMETDVTMIYHASKDFADDTRVLALEAGLINLREPSVLEEWSVLWMLLKKNLWYMQRQRAGRSEQNKLDYDPESLVESFEQRLEKLVVQGQEHSKLVVLLTFATKCRADQPEETRLANLAQAFTFTPYLRSEDILSGYAAYNRAIVRVAERTGAVVVQAADSIPGTDEFFWDSVHFTEKGYEANAQRVFDALQASTQWRDLALAAAETGSVGSQQ